MHLRSNCLKVTRLVLVCSLMCFSESVFAQQQSILSNLPQAVPDATLYHFLFHYALHLQSNLPDVDNLKNGYLTDLFVRQLNMKPDDELTILREAQRCEDETKQIDAQAKAIIDKTRAATPKGKRPSIAPLSQLMALQSQKNQTIERHVAALQSALSPESFVRFSSNLRNRFAKQIHASTVSAQTLSSGLSNSPTSH